MAVSSDVLLFLAGGALSSVSSVSSDVLLFLAGGALSSVSSVLSAGVFLFLVACHSNPMCSSFVYLLVEMKKMMSRCWVWRTLEMKRLRIYSKRKQRFVFASAYLFNLLSWHFARLVIHALWIDPVAKFWVDFSVRHRHIAAALSNRVLVDPKPFHHDIKGNGRCRFGSREIKANFF